MGVGMEWKGTKTFVTGGAGFIGSNLVDELSKRGAIVTIYDNPSTGHENNFAHHVKDKGFAFVKGDLLDEKLLEKSMKNQDIVFHIAANADVRGGAKNPTKDFEQNIVATKNVLEAMRKNNVKKLVFSSSATVYGEPSVFPTPENFESKQTSLYGASKKANEAMVEAYTHVFGIESWIFRFVSLVGKRYSHGVVYDFVRKMKENPKTLEILGDGMQRKSFLDVEDCVKAILLAVEKTKGTAEAYNLGHDEAINVKDLANIVITEMKLKNVQFTFTGGERGWVGDSPFVLLDTKKMKKLGWKPETGLREGIAKTTRFLLEHPETLEWRK